MKRILFTSMILTALLLVIAPLVAGAQSGGYNCGYGGVYDHGPRLHAQGYLYGNTYIVARGDTSFSISQRFGITTQALGAANGINPWHIYAGQRLIIPGHSACQPAPCYGGSCQTNPCYGGNCQTNPCYPSGGYNPGYNCPPYVTPIPPIYPVPITPVPTPVPTTPVIQPAIQITSPAANTTLPPTFVVTGTGQGLFEGGLVVQAVNTAGTVLAQQPATLQGTNVGAGGPGTFSVQLAVNVGAPTPGFIVASAPQTPTAQVVRVPVTFSPGGGGGTIAYHDYTGQQCRVAILVGQPYYADIGAQPLGTFANPGTFVASRGAKQNNQLWFYIAPVPATPSSVWVPITSVGSLSPACLW